MKKMTLFFLSILFILTIIVIYQYNKPITKTVVIQEHRADQLLAVSKDGAKYSLPDKYQIGDTVRIKYNHSKVLEYHKIKGAEHNEN